MPTGTPRTRCKVCNAHRDEVGSLSARGKCSECSDTLIVLNQAHLRAHAGPFFDHWRIRSLAALGVFTPLDDDAEHV